MGSPSILLKNILLESLESVEMYDPWVDEGEAPINEPAIFFIGTNHDKFLDYKFPEGSVVIDPWRMMKEQDGVEYIHVGDSTRKKYASV